MKTSAERNLREEVYTAIRDYVVSVNVPPGFKIDEEALARNLGVSKTPVRESLSKLAYDGIVEIIPNRGSFKARPSKDDIEEIMEIREELEGLAFRLAAERLSLRDIRQLKALHDPFMKGPLDGKMESYSETDKKFHSIIIRASGRKRLIRMLETLEVLGVMLRLQVFNDPQHIRRSIKGHQEMIAALENKNGKLAERLLRKNIRMTKNRLTKLFTGRSANAIGHTPLEASPGSLAL